MVKWVLLFLVMAPGLAAAQTATPPSAPAAAPPSAPAAPPPSANEFAAVMQDAGHRQEVLHAAQATPVWQHRACKAARYTQAPEIGVYAPLRFDASGAPVSGEWREGIVVSGCGPALRLNVLTKVTAPSTLASGALSPGETIADPVLQNVAQFSAVKAAGGLPKTCRAAYVANTAFAGFAKAAGAAGQDSTPWREIWTLNICQAVKRVTLNFIPSPQGVSIAAKLGG
jgi:hypothetical protein